MSKMGEYFTVLVDAASALYEATPEQVSEVIQRDWRSPMLSAVQSKDLHTIGKLLEAAGFKLRAKPIAAPTAQELLKEIKPGKNYPRMVVVKEPDPKGVMGEVKFLLQSYYVGMYCAIYFPGQTIPTQVGDHNNKGFVSKLKKDIQRAIDRGAEVTIEGIVPVKTTMG